MSDNYDTILKEKKVYTEAPKKESKHKFLKLSIFLGILISIIVIVICYIIYYNTILDNESIFFNNLLKLSNKYQPLYKNIAFDYDLNNNYLIEGKIDVGNDNYNYSCSKYGNLTKKSIYQEKNNVTYYTDGKNNYFKITNIGDFYIKDNDSIKLNNLNYYNNKIEEIKKDFNEFIYSSILDKSTSELFNQLYNLDNNNNIIEDIKHNYQNNITSDKYIRKKYYENNKPIVEVNIELNKENINNILGTHNNLQVKDDYKINIIMKNDALSNNIQNIKIIIKNNTKNTREVIQYKTDNIIYTNSKQDKYNIKYIRSKSNIQIKKNGVLYSVIQITSKNNVNIYSYKLIDKIYTVSLSVAKTDKRFEYSIETNIENVAKAVKISGDLITAKPIKEDITKAVNIDTLNIEQQKKYKATIKEIFK